MDDHRRAADAEADRSGSEVVGGNLTPRELEVLRLLVEGKTDREIAAALGVTYRTATTHVGSVFAKLKVRSRTAAAVRAVRDGFA